MKRLFFTLILLAAALFGSAQTVPVKAKTFQITYGAQTFSINLNGDSVLVSSTNRVWFNKKFGSDTLLFGDGTYMTTAAVPGLTDTGYVKTTGDTIHGNYWFNGNSDILFGTTTYLQGGYNTSKIHYDTLSIRGDYAEYAHSVCTAAVVTDLGAGYIEFYNTWDKSEAFRISARHDCHDQDTIVSYNGLIINSPTLTTTGRFNGIDYDGDSTDLINDASVVLTSGIYGWGEVYAFNAGAIDEWAEFIISSDGTVYLKSNSTDVANTDTTNKL